MNAKLKTGIALLCVLIYSIINHAYKFVSGTLISAIVAGLIAIIVYSILSIKPQ